MAARKRKPQPRSRAPESESTDPPIVPAESEPPATSSPTADHVVTQPSCHNLVGIRCPRCGGIVHRVRYTRNRKAGRRRVLQCLYCSREFCTTEKLA